MTPAARLHYAARLLELATHLDHPPDTHDIYRQARIVHDTITRWAFTPTRPTAPTLEENRTHRDDWCRSCLRIQRCEPIHRAGLCTWCYSFQTAQHRGLPCEALLVAHHEGRKITQQLIDKHQPRRKKRTAA